LHSIGNTGGILATANDETKTVLDDASTVAVWLMLDKLAGYDVAEVYEATSRQGRSPISQHERCAPAT
jgi:hypothetical protein